MYALEERLLYFTKHAMHLSWALGDKALDQQLVDKGIEFCQGILIPDP